MFATIIEVVEAFVGVAASSEIVLVPAVFGLQLLVLIRWILQL